MKKSNFVFLILVAAIIAIGSTGFSQILECDGLAGAGTGNFGGSVLCSPLDYMYRIDNNEPREDSVFIGTHDGNIANYTDICLPAGWVFSIQTMTQDDYNGFTPHGIISGGPDGKCPFTMKLVSSSNLPFYFGFNHSIGPHDVGWVPGSFSATSNWGAPVGDGIGPVHAPRCDTSYIEGDVNGDGTGLSTADLVYLDKFVNGVGPPPIPLWAGDLNGDGYIDALDVILFKQFFISGLSVFPQFPIPVSCDPDTIRGACCIEDTCLVLSPFNCDDTGGTYFGDASLCDAVDCPPADSLGSLHGSKFEDLDCDGVQGPAELPLPNWPIDLYLGGNLIASTVTDANGDYWFMNLLPGTYRIAEVVLAGWVQTFPPTVIHLKTLAAGQSIHNLDFGNTPDTCLPPSVIDIVNQVAGTKDNFVVAEASSPDLFDDLLGLVTCPQGATHFFDSVMVNQCFGHTFTGFNDSSCCVISAELCLRIRATGSVPQTDAIAFAENGVFCWGLSLNTLQWYATAGADSSWDLGDTLNYCLDLANLPPYLANITNVLAALQDGDFSILIQDDTEIDFLELTVVRCCPDDSLGSLHGNKFEDLDCDGVQGPAELLIPNWPINLYQGSSLIASTTTDANGNYWFMNLLPGTYRITEDVLAGWVQTYPPTVIHLVTLSAGQSIHNLNFGNTPDTCLPPSVIDIVNEVAGTKDNFFGPEPSTPDLAVDLAGLVTCPQGATHYFDSVMVNQCFAHTFTGFRDTTCCVIGAELCLRILATGSIPTTDAIAFAENGVFCWGLSLNTLQWYATAGADSSWDLGDTLEICLDLADLPPNNINVTNVLAALQDGDFSILIQDDTEIDFLELTVERCCPRDSVGACCLPDGSCITVADAAECDAVSGGTGTFLNGVPCVPNPCPQPPGDSCVEFTVECCDGKPTVAKGLDPLDFSGQIAVATCYADPANPLDEPYVVGIVDLTRQCSAPLGTPASDPNGFVPPMYHNEFPGNPTNNVQDEWHRDNLGSVFGLALDNKGNIYVTATTCYLNDIFPVVHGPGTGGEIYKLDRATGAITLFAFGPLPNSGQGLGNISYDCLHDQMFVSNMDDGEIIRILGVAAGGNAIGIPYDHGVDGRNAAGLTPPIPDDPLQSFTQLGRRIWGLEVVNGTDFNGQPFYRLFYAVWWEDQGNVNASESNEIWSVGLDLTNGNFLPATARLEITLPPLQPNFSNPVSDITFKPDGSIILAERSMFGPTTPGAHTSRLLEYACESGLWVRQLSGTPPVDIFQIPIATVGGSPSCAGGVDFDFRTDYSSPCVGRVWATGDALRLGTVNIYGLAGYPPAGGNSGNNTDCILIDLDAEFTAQDKTELGDVEVPCRCCNGNVGDVNGDASDANILDLTFMVDYIFRGGKKPPCDEEADVNSDGSSANILDLTFLVDRIFRGGKPAGPC